MKDGAETGNGRDPKRAAAGDTAVLPQWAIEVARPVIRRLSSLLWDMRFRGVENIPAAGGLVVAANHQTYIDPFWVSIPIRRPTRYLAWSEPFKRAWLGKPMRWLGAWPLHVEGSDPAAIRRALQWLRGGGVLVIFPEGGRARSDGEVSRFKPGAARLALEAGVPVLPVTIRGAHTVWPRDWRFPRTGHIEIVYHPLHHLTAQPGEDTRHCARRETEQLAALIKAAL